MVRKEKRDGLDRFCLAWCKQGEAERRGLHLIRDDAMLSVLFMHVK